MRAFKCTACRNKVYFENSKCLICDVALGFFPDTLEMSALEPAQDGQYHRRGSDSGALLQYCANNGHGVCNWLIAVGDKTGLCLACDLNRTIPNLQEAGNLEAWRGLEYAKKRLVYSLLRFGLPMEAAKRGMGGLKFDFVRSATTGHKDGVITIDIKEADSVERERQRASLNEPYRSLLGHLRHESGHFYWIILVEAAGQLDNFRAVFGDERADYAAALAKHHAAGPPSSWDSKFVSAYASAHPWEDWAESWAHYLHMVDTLDTAEVEGMEPRAAGFSFGALWPFKACDNYRQATFESLTQRWVPLTLALNNISRSMGHSDFYPFVIPVDAYKKLAFIHRLVRERRSVAPSRP